MALNLSASISFSPSSSSSSSSSNFIISKQQKDLFKLHTCCKAKSEGAAESGGSEQELPSPFSASLSSTRSQLDLLDQLTPSSTPSSNSNTSSNLTIREQLVQLVGIRDEDEDELLEELSIPLGKNLKKFSPKFLTVSQKRNIKRQTYLNQVSKRNDSVFFATIGAFVILPPFIILGIAVLTGYVQLLP